MSAWWKRNPSSGVGRVGPDEPLAHECEQARLDALAFLLRCEVEDGFEREAAAGDGGALEHGALLALEPVEALVEDAADRARHLARGAVLVGDRRELLDEERVSLGRLGDPRSHCEPGLRAPRAASPSRPPTAARATSAVAGSCSQAGRCSASWGRARQSRSTGALAEPPGEVLDEVEEGRLGPVDVVEDGDHRALGGELFEEAARGGEDLVAAARKLSLVASGLPKQLAQRPERDPLAVGRAAADEHGRLARETGRRTPARAATCRSRARRGA